MDECGIDKTLEQKLGFDRIREIVCNRCQSESAAAIARDEAFCTDISEIRKRLTLTDEMRLILMFEDNFPTSGFIDSLDFLLPLRQASAGMDLTALRKLRTMLETLAGISAFFEKAPKGVYVMLRKMSSHLDDFSDISRRINCILDRYGNIKDNASPLLAEIRRDLGEKQSAVSRRAAAVLKRAQQEGLVDADASPVIRDGHTLIPVPSGSKRRINGFIFDESASGKTAFIEPAEVVELTNAITELNFAQQREIVRILFEFSDFIRPDIEKLIGASRYMAQIDFIQAKANTALDMMAMMPAFSGDGNLRLVRARHPLLEKALAKEGRAIVPLSLSLNPQKRILVVSGPNAGGKSVCLKTLGLLQYMFQWGMLIPVGESSEMMLFNRIEASIGDDQNLDNDLSTYSSFLVKMKEIIANADEQSLVLIDEFGSGTEPAAGGAIAEALLARMEKAGVYGIITTHYTNLKLYASREDSRVINGAMAFDATKIEPLFKLEIGLPGNSFAFSLARKMGLDEDLVRDAEERAGGQLVGMERNLRKIERSRRALDEKLERVQKADKTLENITDKYQKELSDIKSERRRIIEEARQQAKEIVQQANREVENTIRTIKESQAEKTQTVAARSQLQGFLESLSEAKVQHDEYVERKLNQLKARQERNEQRRQQRAQHNADVASEQQQEQIRREEAFRTAPLQVGEKVRIKGNAMVGEVAKISGKNLIVTVGNISTKVNASGVARITSNEYKEAVRDNARAGATAPSISTDASIRERKLNFHPEIDLRGERLQEALDKVTSYVDDAIMLGVPQVRIIHGKGTGVLHEELQKYLRSMPGIKTVADEHIQFGGSGVTIVVFE